MQWHIYPANRFHEHRRAWDALNVQGPNSPVLNSAFPFFGLREFGTNSEVLAILGDPESPQTMAILEHPKIGVWDTFQPSQAPLGAWLNASDTPLEQLLVSLASALPGAVIQIGLTQQDPKIYPRPADQGKTKTLDYIETASISTDISFDDYWSGRGKNLRRNMVRQKKRLEQDEITTSLIVSARAEQMETGVAQYGALESAGWKASGGTAISAHNAQGRFYTSLLEEFCSFGCGTIVQYRYNDRLVACDLCVYQGGDFVILKTTYDESIRDSSPAFLMRREFFPRLFDNPVVDTIEFYGKKMEWHTKWSENSRTMYHLNMRRFF